MPTTPGRRPGGAGRLLGQVRRAGRPQPDRTVVPADPRETVSGPLDPSLDAIRAGLVGHRRRLWIRRIVRRAWLAVAAIALLEAALLGLARLIPIEILPSLVAAVAIGGVGAWLASAVRARPSLGETAVAVDGEGRLGDRVSSALSLANAYPSLAGPAELAADDADGPITDAAEAARFVRRQRLDAVSVLRIAPPNLFRARWSRGPAAIALAASLLIVPFVLLPNAQDRVIAEARANRDEALKQASKVEEIAKELESKGAKPDDPRTRLATDLRDLAAQLRAHPEDLKANLARLGSVEASLHSQLDPSNEQRAAALTSLNRSLSRTASGNPNANKDGDPKVTADDLKNLGDKLDSMTPQERSDLAAALAGLQSAASQASGAAGQALRDATQAIAQGQTAAAKEALGRLGDTLKGTADQVQTNRDLATAASQLQETRRALADASRNTAQQGQQGQQGQGQPGQSGQPGQGQPGSSPGAGQSGQPGQGQPGSSGQPGQGQGQGQAQGQIGGGGSSARSLGQAIGGNRIPGAPTGANRASTLGPDLTNIADFSRLGQPGDPSYVAGTGGDGQTQQGNQSGQGQNNGATIAYQQVFSDFYQYALTSLDRNYVPLSVKDFVRDYFSSLDPTR